MRHSFLKLCVFRPWWESGFGESAQTPLVAQVMFASTRLEVVLYQQHEHNPDTLV